MLHLHNSCVSDIENIEYILKKKDYNGVKTNREIKKIFKDLGSAYKNFSESLKKIHNESKNLISVIKKGSDEDNSEQVYFADCFVNIVSVIKNIYEENLTVSEKIQKNIVDEFEKEERERVSDINSIYKEEINDNNNEQEEYVKNEVHISEEEKNNNIHIEGLPLRDIEIDLKRCLENKDFSNKYLNNTKYQIYFSELNKLNLKLDKEIYSFKQLIQKFGKNASKLLIHKSQERISEIQNKKKNILEFLYNDIVELKKNKISLINEKNESEVLIGNKNEKKEYANKEKREDKKNPNEYLRGKCQKNNQNSFFSNLYLEKFEIREKYRIEVLYSSFRIFLKALAVKHINVNKALYKSANEVSSYDSLIDYQKWLSNILKKNLDITYLQEKIQKNNILTKEEEYLLMPSDYNFFNNNSINLFEKENENTSHFQKGELIFKEQNEKFKKEKNEKEINAHRDSQFPDEFYIPIIIKKSNINLTNKNSTNIKHSNKIKEEISIKELLKKNSVNNNLNINTYLNNNDMNKEKDIITFLTNRQKNYEKYLLQFNNLSTYIYQNEKKKDKRKWFDKNFFQGYFYEEGHNFYPFKIPSGMNNLSLFQNIHSFSLNAIDFGDNNINEYDYKLLAYESVLLVYYSLSIQLNCYFLFDVNNKHKINKSSYKKVYEKFSYASKILMSDIDKYYLKNNSINEIEKTCLDNVKGIQNKDNNDIKYQKMKEESEPASTNCVNDYFEYIDYIYNVKLQNLLLIKRIISIFRIKLNLNSKTNDLITLLTIPNHYMNYGYKLSFHVLDIRFRIIRILDSLNFNHIFDFGNKKNEYDKLNHKDEYSIYINWLKRQLHLLYVSLYLKFSRFIKFIPYSNFSFYPYIFDNINIFKNNEEYFSYINKTSEDNSFIRYIKNVQNKIKKIYDFILINKSYKRKTQLNVKISKNDQNKNDVNFVSFNSLEMDEKIIFICNLLLKNIIKSFQIVYKLQSIIKKKKWNNGEYDEKKDLSNLIKYFTKIEYYDFEIRNIMFNIHKKKKNQEISRVSKHDINEYRNKLYNNTNVPFHSEHSSEFNKKKHEIFDDNSNIDYDKLFRNIFINEITYKENSGYILGSKKQTKYNENKTLDRYVSKKNKHISNFFIKKENKNKYNLMIKKNSSNENITIKTYLTKKEKKKRGKIFYKLNVETVLYSCWFIDRILLHFFLYFYFSCIIDYTSKSNMYADSPYIIQGIILIIYYLQSGNDLTLKTKKQYNDGLESTLIPISTFILYFVIHLFYSFFDKDLLSIQENKDQDRLQLFLKRRRSDSREKETDANIRDTYSKYKNQMITVQNASKFYFIVKNFEDFLSYRTADEKILEINKNNIDINNTENYEGKSSYSEETEEKESSIIKSDQDKKDKKYKKKKKNSYYVLSFQKIVFLLIVR